MTAISFETFHDVSFFFHRVILADDDDEDSSDRSETMLSDSDDDDNDDNDKVDETVINCGLFEVRDCKLGLHVRLFDISDILLILNEASAHFPMSQRLCSEINR